MFYAESINKILVGKFIITLFAFDLDLFTLSKIVLFTRCIFAPSDGDCILFAFVIGRAMCMWGMCVLCRNCDSHSCYCGPSWDQ